MRLGLIFAGIVAASCSVASGQEVSPNPSSTQRRTLELERLVVDLNSSSFGVREKAMAQLRTARGALPYLRQHLPKQSVEGRRRFQLLIDELAPKELHRRFAELAKEKADAPLDLIVDLLLENRDYVGDQEWKVTIDLVKAIAAKLNGKKKIVELPDWWDYRKFTSVTRKVVTRKDLYSPPREGELPVNMFRIIADRLGADQRAIIDSCVVLAEQRPPFYFEHSIILVNNSIPKHVRPNVTSFMGCFVFCDGQIDCDEVGNSVIICSSRLRTASATDVISIENARRSSKIMLFSTERVGFKVLQGDKKLRVERVDAGSLAAQSGLKPGDCIGVDATSGNPLANFERTIRTAFARQIDLEIHVCRDNRSEKLVLQLSD